MVDISIPEEHAASMKMEAAHFLEILVSSYKST
jgi:hypothetical protein